jgi:hypothetical protein
MSKSPAATVRRKPVRDVSAATPDGFVIHGEIIDVASTARIQLVDVTDRIMDLVRLLNVREGMVSVWSMHTTCAVLINESPPGNTTTRPTPTARGRTPTRTCARCCSGTAWRSR